MATYYGPEVKESRTLAYTIKEWFGNRLGEIHEFLTTIPPSFKDS
jgi:hypothetical protein